MRDIGVDVHAPDGEWDGNENCPFYGNLRLRGQIIKGVVSSRGMQDAVIVEIVAFPYPRRRQGSTILQTLAISKQALSLQD